MSVSYTTAIKSRAVWSYLSATEEPDMCSFSLTVDWSGDDEEFLLMSEAA